jgi:hypothetical protein
MTALGSSKFSEKEKDEIRSLYFKGANGFKMVSFIDPDYKYVVGKYRKHKFNYRKSRFKNDPSLLWREGLTEKELARLNKIPRIYDGGKMRYVKEGT